MFSKRFAIASTLLLLGAAACGGGDEPIDAEDAGVGPDAGMEVLVDTAATPPGGVPGMGTDAGAAGTAGAVGTPGATGGAVVDTAGVPR